MLEKIITDFKKSLPLPLQKMIGGGVEPEENEQNEELEEADKADKEDPKKKRNSMIIKVLIILGLAYFALDEFVLKNKSGTGGESIDELIAKAPVKKRKKMVKPVLKEEAPVPVAENSAIEKSSEEKKEEIAPEITPEIAKTPEIEETTKEVTEAPVENINVLEKGHEVEIDEEGAGKKIDQLLEKINQETTVENVKIPSQGEEPAPSEIPKKEVSLESKISESPSETPAPAYDEVGRGLVYNCKDKYWACLDKPNYIICNKNMKWNESKGNSKECVVQNIYNTDEDCAKIQKYNVSTNQSTAFCQ